MPLRSAFVVGSIALGMLACSSEGGGVPSSRVETPEATTQPTEPAPSPTIPSEEEQVAKEPAGPQRLSASPACGPEDSRVVLKLGLTRDHRVPDCYRADDARVEFAPGKHATVTLMGPMSDGFCALDVEVPKGAESGKVTVSIGSDVFESDIAFGVPCQ